MNIGVLNRVFGLGLFSILLVACGGSDDEPAANCGTTQSPKLIEIKDVSPALDASVPNASIVQKFTLVGQHLQLKDPSFVLPAAHTAGKTIPTPSQWTLSVSGADTVYTSAPLSWENAPAHVEVESSGLLSTPDGCVWTLPKQIFKYDVTVP